MFNKFSKLFLFFLFLLLSIEVSSKNIILKNNDRLSFDDINSLTSYDLSLNEHSENDLNIIVKELISNELIVDISTTSDDENFYLLISEAFFINQIYINNNLKIDDDDILENISTNSKN
ncbi:hypothetical protein OAQ08_00590, partial [Alphaproteobacteria bacterium]|nr:hypothetical protein [Alphaproteobacteria bacterium]